jgi:ComEC/Rec2-related protein
VPPVAALAAGWVCGIAASGTPFALDSIAAGAGSAWTCMAPAAAAAAASAALALRARRTRAAPGLHMRRAGAALLAGGLCAGFMWGHAAFSRLEAAGMALEGHRTVEGAATADAALLGISTCVPLKLSGSGTLVMVSLPAACAPVRLGDEVWLSGSVRGLRLSVPKDRPALLRGEAAWIQGAGDVAVSPPRSLLAPLYMWRDRVLERWCLSSSSESALLRAVAFGDDGGLDEATRGDFRRSGLAHLVAASGAYAAVLALLVGWLARRYGAPQRASRFAAIAVVAAYAALTGFKPSVIRSALILGAYALAWSSGRRVAALAPVAVAALAISAVWPFAVFSVGFGLSVGAVIAIAFWSAPISARLSRVPEAVRRPLALALAVEAGLAPVLAADFSQVSLVGPLASVLVWPLLPPMIALALVSGLACLVPAGSSGPSAVALAGACLVARLMAWVARSFASLPWAAIPVTGPPVVVWLVYYASLEGLLRRGSR